jgi:phosphoribosylanthranilate isomerase
VTVKICGLTSAEDARAAIAAGADYLGFVYFPASRRCLRPADSAWVRQLPGVPKVGVFRDQPATEVARLREEAGLDMVQLHGHESAEECALLGGPKRVIKAVSVAGLVDWRAVALWARNARILFDTASPAGGGSGRVFDWSVLSAAPFELSFWLAGGLRPDNVASAIEQTRPAGVDVASGVEAAGGRKDAARMRAFVGAVRAACGAGRGEGTEGMR